MSSKSRQRERAQQPVKRPCRSAWAALLVTWGILISGCAVPGDRIADDVINPAVCPSCGQAEADYCCCYPDPWSAGYHLTVWSEFNESLHSAISDHPIQDAASENLETLEVPLPNE